MRLPATAGGMAARLARRISHWTLVPPSHGDALVVEQVGEGVHHGHERDKVQFNC